MIIARMVGLAPDPTLTQLRGVVKSHCFIVCPFISILLQPVVLIILINLFFTISWLSFCITVCYRMTMLIQPSISWPPHLHALVAKEVWWFCIRRQHG